MTTPSLSGTKRHSSSTVESDSKRAEHKPSSQSIYSVIEKSFAVWKKLKFTTKGKTGDHPYFFIKYDPKSGEWLDVEDNPNHNVFPQTFGQSTNYLRASYEGPKTGQGPKKKDEKKKITLLFPDEVFKISMGALKVFELNCSLACACSNIEKTSVDQFSKNTYWQASHNPDEEKKYIPKGKLSKESKQIADVVLNRLEHGKDPYCDDILGKEYKEGSFDSSPSKKVDYKEGELVVIQNSLGKVFARTVKQPFSKEFAFRTTRNKEKILPPTLQNKVIARWTTW